MEKKYKATKKCTLVQTTTITWTLEELTNLVNDDKSHVHLVAAKRHIALHPCQLGNLKQSLHDILGDQINFYDDKLNGLFLAYKNPKLLSKNAAMLYDSFLCHVDIEADFYVFRPKIGYTVKGIINKKATNHLGVLVHKAFNVSIPKKDDDEDWQGHYLNTGDEVTFTVQMMDLKPGKGKLPFIRGQLVSSETEETSMVTKPKIFKFDDEDVNSDSNEDNNAEISEIGDKKPRFSSTVNEGNSSDSEEEADQVSVKRQLTETQKQSKKLLKDSSEDCKPVVADWSGPNMQHLSENGDIEANAQDSSDSSDDDTVLQKPPEKFCNYSKNTTTSPTKGKIQVASSDDSDDEEPVNKSIAKGRVKGTPSITSTRDKSESFKNEKLLKKNPKITKQQVDSDDSHSDAPISNTPERIISECVTTPSAPNVNGKNSTFGDSNDALPISNTPTIKAHKKGLKKSTIPQRDSNDSDDDLMKKSTKKSPKKTQDKSIGDTTDSEDRLIKLSKKDRKSRDKAKTDTSHVSDNDTTIVDKSGRKSSPKKSSKNIQQDSKESAKDSPNLTKSVKEESSSKRKEKRSECENSIDETIESVRKESKKLKKLKRNSSKSKDDQETSKTNESSSNIVEHDESSHRIETEPNHISTNMETAEQILEENNVRKKNFGTAHDMSSSEDDENENIRNISIKVERESSVEASDQNRTNSFSKTLQSTSLNASDDSDDDFESFMRVRKIESDNDLDTSKMRKSTEKIKATMSGPQPDVLSSESSISHEKSKKAPANAEVDDSIRLHADIIKPEDEMPRANGGDNEQSSLNMSKKIKKEKSKKKRSKSVETYEETPESDTSLKIKKEKDKTVNSQVAVNIEGECENITTLELQTAENELLPRVKKEKHGKKRKESIIDKSGEPETIVEQSISRMSPPTEKPKRVKKRKSSKASFPDDNDELSDASTKSRILVKREESVFFSNIKMKHEPYASDVESVSSRKRKRKDSTSSSIERNNTFEDIRIKRESSVVKSEQDSERNRKLNKSLNGVSIKCEANASDVDDAPPRKKTKKKFSE